MSKLGYILYHQDAIDIIEQGDFLTSSGCSMVFMDPYNKQKVYPQFELLLAQSKPNDELIVKDLSYLATSFQHLSTILECLQNRALHLICLNQTINTRDHEIQEFRHFINLFADMLRHEMAYKRKVTRSENERSGKLTSRVQGIREKTYLKAREVYDLQREGRLTNKEIMELTNIKPGNFYKYCKWGKDGLLSNGIESKKPRK
ncbi:MAG: recombinase family protein [bacterium]|nr:recombinase family protein [bacterium]